MQFSFKESIITDVARREAIKRLKKTDEDQGSEPRRYKWEEIEEEINVIRGVDGYDSEVEESKWAEDTTRRRNHVAMPMDTE